MGSPTTQEWLTETKVSPTDPVTLHPRTAVISDKGLETLRSIETQIANGATPTQAAVNLPATAQNEQLLQDLKSGLSLHRALINQPTYFGTRAGVLLKTLGPHIPLVKALPIVTTHLATVVTHRKQASRHFQLHAALTTAALLMSSTLHPAGPSLFAQILAVLGTTTAVIALISLIFMTLGTYTTFTLLPLTPYSRYSEQAFTRSQLLEAAAQAHLPKSVTETLLKETGVAPAAPKPLQPPSWLATHILPISAGITMFLSALAIWAQA